MVSDDLSFMARHGARLVDNGYPAIPIMPGTKKPGRYRRGRWTEYPGWSRHCRRMTTGHEVEVWSMWPEAGVGVACGEVIGVDIDIATDTEVAFDLERLARERLGDTPALRIGCSPKRLLVYRATTLFAGIKRAPIEVLGLGRQFVAYGIHPTTDKPYVWPEESLADLPLERLPAIDEEQAHAFVEEAYERVPQELLPNTLAPERSPLAGERSAIELRGTPEAISAALAFVPNNDLDYDSWVRIGMALKGALGEDGRELFEGWSALSQKHVAGTTAETWASLRPERIGAGTIYHHALAAGWTPPLELLLNGGILVNGRHPARALLERLRLTSGTHKNESDSTPPGPTPAPDGFFDLDGALGLFVDYMLATAIRPQPVLAVGATLAALGVLMGRRYRTPSNLRSNLYVIGLAPSGAGKDHARSCIKEAFLAAGLSQHLGGNRIASGAGLLAALYREPASLFQLDEFGQFLAGVVDKRRAPRHLAEIWDNLTELATSAGGTFLGAEYADQKQRPRQDIVQPCCGVHATSVPEAFWAALQCGSLLDGSLARFLVFQSDVGIPDRVKSPARLEPAPGDLVAALQRIVAGVPGHGQGNVATATWGPVIKPDPYTVPLTQDAEALFDEIDAEVTARQREAEGGGHGAVLARVWESTAKVALVKAVSANAEQPVIRVEDASWARLVVDRCVDTLLREAERHLADNETERNHKKVLAIVTDAGSAGIGKSSLIRRTQFLDKRQREDVLCALIEAGLVVAETRQSETRPMVAYRAAGD